MITTTKGITNLFAETEGTFVLSLLLLEELSTFFLIEVISVCILDNHWHAVLFAPGEKPSLEDVAKRHNAFYGAKKIELNPSINPERCAEVAEQVINISSFLSIFQQRFTCYINRVHKRRGTLWADRFKSTILEGSQESLWNCVKYVELNPVRAGIVEDPADYRFCSWGRFCGSGKHPFHANFCKHMRAGAEHHSGESLSDDQVIAEFRGELARIRSWEADQDGTLDKSGRTKAEVTAKNAREKGDSMAVRFLRRTRYWTDGAIIGSKGFVDGFACHSSGVAFTLRFAQEVSCMFEDPEHHL